jgi:TonB family protein
MLAHVKEKWRYYALAEGCQPARDRVRIGFPHVSCAPIPMPETQTSPDDVDVQDRPRSTDLSISVIPDGTVVAATVLHSSGVAALDQAAVAHVMRTWRWRPFSCPRSPDVISGNATVGFDYAVPDPPAPKP